MAEEKKNDSSPLETVRKVLKDGKLNPQEFEGGTGFVMSLDDELYEGAIIHVLEDRQQFVFYVEFRAVASEAMFAQTAEFITRANFWILIGNFEMDYDDGTVRYRSGVDYAGNELTYELVRNAIVSAKVSTERYGHALVEVIAGKKSALEAIKEVEAAMDAE